METNEYQKAAMRTECRQDVSRLRIVGNVCLGQDTAAVPMLTPVRMIHACTGMSAEVGEIQSLMQKWLYYGRQIGKEEFAEELGDLLWYVAQMCETLGLDMAEIMESNIAKLKARYPERFKDVVERDGAAESNARRSGKSSDPRIVQDGHGFGHAEDPNLPPDVREMLEKKR